MKNKTSFLQLAAICSFAGALTTGLLIFLPTPAAADFESRALLHQNNLYLARLWILFLHPQFNFIAALGIALVLFRKHLVTMVIGTMFLFVWAYTEVTQQALLIDALNQYWRPGYLAATDEASRAMFRTLIEGAGAMSDSHYFLVLYGFGLGSLLYGLAFWKEEGYGKWLGVALVFIGLLSISSFGRYYLGLDFLSPAVDGAYTWIYPYLQPAVRIGLGLWLLKQTRST